MLFDCLLPAQTGECYHLRKETVVFPRGTGKTGPPAGRMRNYVSIPICPVNSGIYNTEAAASEFPV